MESPSTLPSQAPLHVRPKVGRNVLTFSAILIGITLVVLFALAFAVAKTGLMEVPFFSRFYHGPQPTRQVDAVPMTAEQFRQLLGQRFIQAKLAAGDSNLRVEVTEKEISAVLAAELKKGLLDPSAKIEHTQMVFRPQDIELATEFRQKSARVDLLMRLVPVVDQGVARFEIREVHLGDYPIAPSIALKIASFFFSRDLGTWAIDFGEVNVQQLELRDGVMTIVAAGTRR